MDSEVSEEKYIKRIFLRGEIEADDPFDYYIPTPFSEVKDTALLISQVYKELRNSELDVWVNKDSAGRYDPVSVSVVCELPLPFNKDYFDCYHRYEEAKRLHEGYDYRKKVCLQNGWEAPEYIPWETVEQNKKNAMILLGKRFKDRQKSLIKIVSELFPLISKNISRDLSWSKRLGVVVGKAKLHHPHCSSELQYTERLEQDLTIKELMSRFP